MSIEITQKEMYAYALGYFYGRSQGNDPGLYSEDEGSCRHFYLDGYEAGVSDYCYMADYGYAQEN